MIGRSSSSHDGIAIVLAALETARPLERERGRDIMRTYHVQTETVHLSSTDGLTGDKLELLQWNFAVLVFCRTRTVEPMTDFVLVIRLQSDLSFIH